MNPEKPPPRYEIVDGESRLITDEAEWLARPAAWGIDLLPDEIRGCKSGRYRDEWGSQFFAPLLRRQTGGVCKNLLVRLLAPDRDPFHDMQVPGELARYRTLHPRLAPDEECDSKPIFRSVMHHARDIICHAEALHAIADFAHSSQRMLPPGEQKALRQAREIWERWLALELVGPNPFRPIAFELRWRTETVLAFAKFADESADFGNLLILADALEESGCEVPEILDHLRGTSPHIRGCWVIDGLLHSPELTSSTNP